MQWIHLHDYRTPPWRWRQHGFRNVGFQPPNYRAYQPRKPLLLFFQMSNSTLHGNVVHYVCSCRKVRHQWSRSVIKFEYLNIISVLYTVWSRSHLIFDNNGLQQRRGESLNGRARLRQWNPDYFGSLQRSRTASLFNFKARIFKIKRKFFP